MGLIIHQSVVHLVASIKWLERGCVVVFKAGKRKPLVLVGVHGHSSIQAEDTIAMISKAVQESCPVPQRDLMVVGDFNIDMKAKFMHDELCNSLDLGIEADLLQNYAASQGLDVALPSVVSCTPLEDPAFSYIPITRVPTGNLVGLQAPSLIDYALVSRYLLQHIKA